MAKPNIVAISSYDETKLSALPSRYCKTGEELKESLKKPIEINWIYNIDCLLGLKLMDDNSVTITITSPPYNFKTSRGVQYDEYEDNLSPKEYLNLLVNVIKELVRVSKYYVFFNVQVVRDNMDIIIELQNILKPYIKEIIIWSKKNPLPSCQPNALSSKWEYVFVFAKPESAKYRSFEYCFWNSRLKGPLNTNVIETNNSAPERFTGRNQCKAIFPREFVYWFLQKFTQKGDIVLDPFNGLGTTAVTCKKTGRDFIGFELSENYCEISSNRINNLEEENWKFIKSEKQNELPF